MKKGFMKTLEMLFVVVLSSIFLIAIIPKIGNNPIEERQSYLVKLEKNEEFRDFINGNDGCFNSSNAFVSTFLERYAENNFEYALCSDSRPERLPQKTVHLDMLFFAGNLTSQNYKIARLYYWKKD